MEKYSTSGFHTKNIIFEKNKVKTPLGQKPPKWTYQIQHPKKIYYFYKVMDQQYPIYLSLQHLRHGTLRQLSKKQQ